MMKFACNHRYRFASPNLAYLTGLTQTLIIGMIELVNTMVLISAKDSLSIMLNFMGLLIISEFDNYLYASLRDEPVKKLLENESFVENCLIISRTSSTRALS